jgi:hypothetical protein
VQPASLPLLSGTWRRRWIRWPDGREDATTAVWWVQAGRYYGDLRLPAPGPRPAAPEGFAGELVERDGVFEWRRDVDLRPTGRGDAGRLRFLDPDHARMIEEGADEPYTELWERVGVAASGCVLRLDRPVFGRGWFVATGADFILATERPHAGAEVSYGRRDPGGANGTVVASTSPSRVGRRAFDDGNATGGGWTLLG